jgi:hypothetical protein
MIDRSTLARTIIAAAAFRIFIERDADELVVLLEEPVREPMPPIDLSQLTMYYEQSRVAYQPTSVIPESVYRKAHQREHPLERKYRR